MEIHKTYKHIVPKGFNEKIRLRNYLIGKFPYLETGSAVKKALKRGQIMMNGEIGKSGDWIIDGYTIVFTFHHNVSDTSPGELDIYYEDEYFMVIRKPAGVSSSGNMRSLQGQLKSYALKDSDLSLPYPYLSHRLDKATEGLMIAAKDLNVRRLFNEYFNNHSIKKFYVLIAEGRLQNGLKNINLPVDGFTAFTEIIESEVLDTKDLVSRVKVQLHSGRTHQIRKHFLEIGHPLVGDKLYNVDGLDFKTGLLLCAYRLEFTHPLTEKPLLVEMPIPQKIGKYKLQSGRKN